jgi:dinuclear metal center YbgI/SA1388 family protein
MPTAHDIAQHLDALLRVHEIPDYPPALNGLQLQSRGEVTRVAAAVDFSLRTVDAAIAADADLLLVHHGMFWGGAQRITGLVYERIARLVARDVAVYAAHLPLDAHPTLGNNALLARTLGLVPSAGFARYQTVDVGLRGECDERTSDIVERARAHAHRHDGDVVATPFAADRRTYRWAVCTGAGASSDTLREALSLGVDTLIVGEGPHHTAVEAADQGLVVVYAGHYATETLGVCALAEEVERAFGVPWTFVEAPTGL